MTTMSVLVERLEQAAHAVRLARYELLADPGWEWWHESLWQMEHLLAGAAESIHTEDLRHQAQTTRRAAIVLLVEGRR